ncbi:helix-turn-helix transcriptional regulator [Pseudonocardia saturnea]
MTPTPSPSDPLLERVGELAAIDVAVAAAAAGRGGLLVIEGPAGIGKTRLVAATRAAAEGRGFQVLAARADRLERDYGFGVVRGLLEAAVRGLPADHRAGLFDGAAGLAGPVLDPAGEAPVATFATLHGVYWLLAALAERSPLLVSVDDGHWADEPSLRALHHLARRIADLPVLLVLATRPAEPGGATDLLDALRAESDVLRPVPLSRDATATLARTMLGAGVDPDFEAACHDVAGGNPMLLGALLRSLRAAGVTPSAAHVDAVLERAPAIVSAFVLPRLRHLPAAAAATARALAVLGPAAALRHLAALAGLDAHAAAVAVDQLVAADLVVTEPRLAFAHPLIGQAVTDRMPAAERQAAHTRAARELAADAAPAEAVAAHLLHVAPLRDAWTVRQLRAAAAAALASGAPQAATTYLERALTEPPAPDQRPGVLFELGSAQTQLGPTRGLERLGEALGCTVEPTARARVALRLARGLETAWELPRALDVLGRAVVEADTATDIDPELRLLLQAEYVGLARSRPSARPDALTRLRRLLPHARPDSVAGCTLLAASAVELLQVPGRATDALDQAARAADGVLGLRSGSFDTGVLYMVAPVLAAAGDPEAAARAADAAVVGGRRRAAPLELGAAYGARADSARRVGALLDAESDARLATEIAVEFDIPYPVRLILGYLLPVLVERGQVENAERELAGLQVDHRQTYLQAGIGRLRLAQDRPGEALRLLLACGRGLEKRGWFHPGLLPWETDAALAHHRCGETDRARDLASTALARARRFEAPVAVGIALRTVGLLEGDPDALRESTEVLGATAARLEHAHSLVELGAALRRANHRVDAREPLRAGLDLAHRCAATALATRATEELAAAGARPRSPRRTGVEALSPSEHRVARLAAQGLTNRDIAQALFVTTKTVEVHLSSCYRKLAITSRAALPEVFHR